MSVHDPYAAMRMPHFRLLLAGRLVAQIGEQMVSVAVGWEIYEKTRDPFLLGMIGLVQVIPVFLFSLPAGVVVDRFNRKRVTLYSQLVLIGCALALTLLSATNAPLIFTFVTLAVIGTARAFNNPAEGTLTPLLVPESLYQNAATWSTAVWQLSAVTGPAIGGILIGLTGGAVSVYIANVFAGLALVGALLIIRPRPQAPFKSGESPVESVRAGLRFLRHNKVILPAITLDMFAVLLGGAVYLLPIYARDILQVGAEGLGLLRAALPVGALSMAVIIANRPPFQNSGRTLLLAVAGFGVATIIFGLSTSFWLSMAMMALLGALDYISVVIRHTLELVFTPDEMRGRIAAVKSIFIGASNELGGFESGVAAAILGPVGAVVFGGFGTLLVVAAVARFAPELRDLKRITRQRETTAG
jgi:MFS family permease